MSPKGHVGIGKRQGLPSDLRTMMAKNLYRLPDTIRHPQKRALLKALAKSGAVRRACAAAGVHHSTYYEWRNSEPAFAAEVAEAREHYIEWLEQRLDDMATDEKKPNVVAMIFRLKALRPEVYRERQQITLTRQERESRIAELLAKLPSRSAAVSANGANGHTNGDGHVQQSDNEGGGGARAEE
jgi:hypothetical protein